MFSDFYEKFNFKKTTPEEKKEVVNNTGEYFPEDHSNKIKGMDELAEAVVDNAMKKQDEILSVRPAKRGYMWKKCAICGKVFESYRGVGKYCSDKCIKKADANKQKEYQKRKTEKEKMLATVNKCRRCDFCGKAFAPTHGLQKYCSSECARSAENKRQKEYYYKCATKKAKKTKVVEEPKVVIDKVIESVEMFDYIGTLRVAIDIVQDVKNTDDVKLAIDKVYDTLKKLKNISE